MRCRSPSLGTKSPLPRNLQEQTEGTESAVILNLWDLRFLLLDPLWDGNTAKIG